MTEKKIAWDKISPQLGEWSKYFYKFWEIGGFEKIYQTLKKEKARGRKILPESKDVFRMFREVSPKDVTVIQYFLDPYPTLYQGKVIANGIAVDCENTGKLQPSLSLWYDGLQNCYGRTEKFKRNPSLRHYYSQGILFLNTALTVEYQKVGSHKEIWQEFNRYLIEEVFNLHFSGLPIILYGKEAQKLENVFIPFNFHIIKVEHMAAASHQNREWNHDNVFKKIDTILKNNNNITLNWFEDE